MIEEELLKPTEEKPEAPKEDATSSPVNIDKNRVEVLLKIRREKLSAVKPFITLKLHDQILDKIEKESIGLSKQIEEKKVEAAKLNREQSLPKAFFEQRYMKIKTIRID